MPLLPDGDLQNTTYPTFGSRGHVMADGIKGLSPSDADTLDLASVAGGTRVRLRVKPGARRRALLGVHAGALKLSVTTAPERGKANRSVIRLLATVLDLPASAITLLSGQGSQDKTILVPLSPHDLRQRLVGGAG